MKGPLLLRRAAVLAYCAFIFYLSSRSEFPDVKPWWPALLPDPSIFAHFFLYAGLSVAVWHDFRKEPFMILSGRAPLAAVAFCLLYGLSDEFHQLFVPNRSFQLIDLTMDTLGPAAAMIALHVWMRRKPRPAAGNR